MRGGRIAAGTASLALTSGLAFAPAAAAAPAAPADRPRAAPTPTKKPAKPKKTQQRAPAPKCNKQIGQPASAITIEPWAQRRLDFEQAWPITRGGGVTVAVVDSGINAAHPQLKGKVAASFDASGTTTDDCLGHGTEVAASSPPPTCATATSRSWASPRRSSC